MCTRGNIVGALQALNWMMGFLGVIMFAFGVILSTKEHWSQAYGTVIETTGGFVIFLSLLMCPVTLIGSYGSKNHNKFMLMIYIGICGFSIFLMLLLGGILLAPTVREQQTPFQIKCLKTRHDEPPWPPSYFDGQKPAAVATRVRLDGECDAYLRGDMLQGFKIVWATYHENSYSTDEYKQLIIDIQRSGKCCGFGRPLGCVEDARGFPGRFPSPTTYLYGGVERQRCGVQPGWYPPTAECNQVVDPNVYPPVYGGCPYEFPIGECMANAPSVENAHGCAAEVEKIMEGKVGGLAAALLWLSLVPILAISVSCCLFLKRKEHDVLPETHPGLNKHKQKQDEKPDVDGMLMLEVAEGPHEFIAAFTRLQAECRGVYPRIWDEQTFIRVGSEKKQACDGKGWNKEVETAFMGTLKTVSDMTSQAKLDAG